MGLTGFNRARRAAQDAAEAAAENDTAEQTTDLEAAEKALAEKEAAEKALAEKEAAEKALAEKEAAEKAQAETITDLPDTGTDAQPLSGTEQVEPVKEQPAKTSKSKKAKANA